MKVCTWLDAVRIDLLQLLCDSLQFLDRTACDGPFQVRVEVADDVLSTELPSVTCGTEEDNVEHAILTGSHDLRRRLLNRVDDSKANRRNTTE